MKDKPTPSTQSQQRVIRVFVSSTFRDMQAERNELVLRIFPQLRKICERRGVTWGEVDLRWGITDEKKAEGKVLPFCLAEIHKCRPYFIGLLGERYGWVPLEISQDLIEQQPWLKEHPHKSITELEILHGVLKNPEMTDHALFYFRDPEFIDTLPPDRRIHFQEVPAEEEIKKLGRKEAARRAEERKEKLKLLKKRIDESKLPVKKYPDPKAMGELVLKDLTEIINTLFPEEQLPDPLDREAAEHEAFLKSRTRVYIMEEERKKKYLKRLNDHAQGAGPPLIVLGESGSGKSALLANWVREYSESHKEAFIITHFIGASPYSADWALMLRRIMGELKRWFKIEQEIPDKPDALRSAFANWLHMAAERGRVIIILDALNQLEDRDQALNLIWLPPAIPSNIRLILSTLPGRPLKDIKTRNWAENSLSVESLTKEERKQFIIKYLKEYARELDPVHLSEIAHARQTSNPLYLQTLLEELRVYGDYETLGNRIDHYLKAKTIEGLYTKVLERWEKDYERDRPGLVREVMSLLWAARRGLSEGELLEMLGRDGSPLPGAHWSPLYLAAEHALVSRSGLISFFHDYLRQAVQRKYLSFEKEQNAAHLRLADYFNDDARRLEPRSVDELPYQLSKAGSYKRLYHLLSDIPFFEKAWNVNQFEVKGYWAQIETNSQLKMTDAYSPLVEAPGKISDANRLWDVAALFTDTGHPNEAFSLREFLVRHFRKTRDYARLQGSLGNQAIIFQAWGRLEEAMKLHKESEEICRELGEKDGLAISLGNQANILYARGELDQAMEMHKEEERICRELGNKNGLARSIGNQALILQVRGRLDEAMKLHKEQERICRELGNKDGLARSLGNQANILQGWGELDQAMELHKESERICKELGNKGVLAHSLDNQALILQDWGRLEEAMKLHKESERLCRELGKKNELSISLGNQAAILQDWGRLEEAMKLQKEQERICRELGNKDGLSISLGGQANILYARGELDQAMKLLKESERIYRELGNKKGLAISLGNQAGILKDRGRLKEAMKLHKEQERICRELGNKDGLSISLGGQANILYARGELDEAMKLHKEEERICQELGNKGGLAASLGNQGIILKDRGELDEAMKLYKEQESICRELENNDWLAISLANQAELLDVKLNRSSDALPLAEESYRLATENGLNSLAEQIKPILDTIRSKLS